MFSKVPGSLGGSDSSLLSACCLTLGSAGMADFLNAMRFGDEGFLDPEEKMLLCRLRRTTGEGWFGAEFGAEVPESGENTEVRFAKAE